MFGQTPWQVLHDPRRAFNLTVMRARDEFERIQIALAQPATPRGKV
jgi:hypothetical protein